MAATTTTSAVALKRHTRVQKEALRHIPALDPSLGHRRFPHPMPGTTRGCSPWHSGLRLSLHQGQAFATETRTRNPRWRATRLRTRCSLELPLLPRSHTSRLPREVCAELRLLAPSLPVTCGTRVTIFVEAPRRTGSGCGRGEGERCSTERSWSCHCFSLLILLTVFRHLGTIQLIFMASVGSSELKC